MIGKDWVLRAGDCSVMGWVFVQPHSLLWEMVVKPLAWYQPGAIRSAIEMQTPGLELEVPLHSLPEMSCESSLGTSPIHMAWNWLSGGYLLNEWMQPMALLSFWKVSARTQKSWKIFKMSFMVIDNDSYEAINCFYIWGRGGKYLQCSGTFPVSVFRSNLWQRCELYEVLEIKPAHISKANTFPLLLSLSFQPCIWFSGLGHNQLLSALISVSLLNSAQGLWQSNLGWLCPKQVPSPLL